MNTGRYPRIVSLVPYATEIVCALGFSDQLVGRSHECDYPRWVKRLPACTEPNFAAGGSSREINARVRDLLHAALSVYRVNAPQLAALAPDAIITQTQCDACAVSLEEVERAIADTVISRPRLISLDPRNLANLWNDITPSPNTLTHGSARGR